MRAPTKITPSNPYPNQRAGFAQAPSTSFAGIAEEVGRIAGQLDSDRKQQQLADLNAAYVKEVGQLDQDFVERRDTSEPGAYGFTLATQTAYAERHKKMLEGLAATKMYTPQQLDQLSTQLAEKRNSFIVPGLNWEKTALGALNDVKLDNLATDFSQQAATHPERLEDILTGVDASVDMTPGYTSVDRIARKQKIRDAVSLSAATGYATANPLETIKALTGHDPSSFAPPVAGKVTATGNAAKVADTLRSGGLSEAVVAGFLGNLQVESNLRHDGPAGDGGKAQGLAQHHPERLANFQEATGVAFQNSTLADQTKFILWELDHPERAGMTRKQVNEIKAAATPEEAAKLIDKYYERSDGKSIDRRVKNATKFFTPDAPGTPAAPDTPLPIDGKTGIPALDNIDAQQRFRMLTIAQQEYSKVQTQVKAETEVKHANALAQAETGAAVQDAPTAEEYNRVYGPVIGPQKFEQLQVTKQVGTFTTGMKTMSDAQIAAGVAALKPKNPETYAVDQKAYEAAQQAAQQTLAARQQDPAGYVVSQYPGVAEAWGKARDSAGRQQAYAAMQAAYDKIGVPIINRVPLTAQQVSQTKAQFETYSPEQKLATIVSWQKEMGPLYVQGLRQLSDGGLGTETYLATLITADPKQIGMAADVLRGEKIMRENKSLGINDQNTYLSFRNSLSPATQLLLLPGQADAIRRSAMALYVADGNDPAKILPGTRALEPYVRQALGGDKNNPNTGWFSEGLRGVPQQTILPPGVTDNQFKNWKEGLTANDFAQLGGDYPRYNNGKIASLKDMIDNGVMVRVAPDRYQIRLSPTGGTMINRDGTPYIMVIKPQTIRKHF